MASFLLQSIGWDKSVLQTADHRFSAAAIADSFISNEFTSFERPQRPPSPGAGWRRGIISLTLAKIMISVDTNVIVRLLTGDDPIQLERSKALFSTDAIFIPTSVVLECEWVLRYAYNFRQPEITTAFQSLFGLPNVHLENPHEIAKAIEWHQNGMDFAVAIHLALSEEAEAFITFDKSLINAAPKNTTIPVREH